MRLINWENFQKDKAFFQGKQNLQIKILYILIEILELLRNF